MAYNRQQLLTDMNQYEDEVLYKLHVIANSILNPNLNQLTSADFSSMVDMVFSTGGLADTYFPAWTDKSKSDFGRFLVELFALFSDKDFFYINHYSKEAFGTTAELYRSLVHKSRSNGFTPPSNLAAVTVIDVTFAPSAGENVDRGAIVFGLAGVDGFEFSNDAFTIPANGSPQVISVTFRHGIIKQAVGNFNYKSIVIDDEGVCDSTVELVVDGDNSWTETGTFANGISTTKHFMVFYNEEAKAEIVFAKGGFGVYPAVNTPYSLTYRKGGGLIGNIAAGLLDQIVTDDTVTGVTSFVQGLPASGGANCLSLEQLRQRYIGFQRNLNRAVTDEDIETIAKELQWVHNAKSESIANYSFLYIVPVGTHIPTAPQITEVENYFLSPMPKLGMGRALLVGAAGFITVTLDIKVYILSGFSNSAAQTVTERVVQDYLDPNRYGKFGGGVVRSYLASLIIQSVQGCQNVDFDQCEDDANPTFPVVNDVFVNNSQLVDYSNSTITITVIGGQ